MTEICATNERRQPDSALSGREICGAPDPGLAPRRLSSVSPAPGYTLAPFRGWDHRIGRITRRKEGEAPDAHAVSAEEKSHRKTVITECIPALKHIAPREISWEKP